MKEALKKPTMSMCKKCNSWTETSSLCLYFNELEVGRVYCFVHIPVHYLRLTKNIYLEWEDGAVKVIDVTDKPIGNKFHYHLLEVRDFSYFLEGIRKLILSQMEAQKALHRNIAKISMVQSHLIELLNNNAKND